MSEYSAENQEQQEQKPFTPGQFLIGLWNVICAISWIIWAVVLVIDAILGTGAFKRKMD